jgi:hypothetical protein
MKINTKSKAVRFARARVKNPLGLNLRFLIIMYSYCYVSSDLDTLFYCVVLCIVCV